jgi:hypothetical protein
MTVVGLVLLIARERGRLLLASTRRGREISVRLAIGASRRQSSSSSKARFWRARRDCRRRAGVGALQACRVSSSLPVDVAFDLRVDASVAFRAALTGVLAGLLPAIKASAPSLVSDLRDAPAGRLPPPLCASRRARGHQVALTVVLVVAGLLLDLRIATRRRIRPRGLAAVSYRHGSLQPERSQVFWRAINPAGFNRRQYRSRLQLQHEQVRVDSRTYSEGQRDIIENTMVR